MKFEDLSDLAKEYYVYDWQDTKLANEIAETSFYGIGKYQKDFLHILNQIVPIDDMQRRIFLMFKYYDEWEKIYKESCRFLEKWKEEISTFKKNNPTIPESVHLEISKYLNEHICDWEHYSKLAYCDTLWTNFKKEPEYIQYVKALKKQEEKYCKNNSNALF